MKHVLKKGKAEGSVLFTVISVMLVMVVFLMSTMVLTSSANRRSYYTYYETQAQYAAQAALDAVTNSAYTDEGFYNWVKSQSAAATVTVSFHGSQIQFTDKNSEVRCTIERADNDTMVWDDLTQAVHQQTAYKITATASVGNGKNRSDYTVCNYIYENFRVPDNAPLPTVDNNAENIIHKWNKSTTTDDDEDSSGSLSPATWSFGPASTGNNMTYFGPQYSGMSETPAGRLKYAASGQVNKKSNENYAVGNVLMIGTYEVNGSKSYYTFEKLGESAQFYGDITINQDGSLKQGLHFNSKLSNAELGSGTKSYGQIPYIYVDGMMNLKGGVYIGMDENVDGSKNRTPGYYNVNLYCGGLDSGNNSGYHLIVGGDAYLYDPSMSSRWMGMKANTNLAYFSDNNFNRTNSRWDKMTVGGNLVCNNKRLELNMNGNDKVMTIDGNLVFTNPAGELVVSNPITVSGMVLCAGNITQQSINNINCDTIVTRSYAKVNTKVLTAADPGDFGEYVGTEGTIKYFKYDNFFFDKYSDLTYQNNKSAGQYDSYKATGYAQMPFCMRLDEIFDEYYRWDLQCLTKDAAEKMMSTDPMVAESISTGHAWGVKEINNVDRAYVIDEQTWEYTTVEMYDKDDGQLDQMEAAGFVFTDKGTWGGPYMGADGQQHNRITKYEVKVISSETGHWVEGPVTVHVPYAVATNKDNKIITHFTPKSKQSVDSTYYVDDYSEFTGSDSMKNAPTYKLVNGRWYKISAAELSSWYEDANKSLTNATKNVSVVYHTQNGSADSTVEPTATVTLGDAMVITESCYLDVTQPNNLNVFIDPYAGKHSDSDPLDIVIKGNGVRGTFVVNNTATYSGDDYTKYTTLKSQNKIAGRRQVRIFLDCGDQLGGGAFKLFMSGAYAQATEGNLNVVANPIYPTVDPDGWAKLPPELRYAYELVPNTVIYGHKNGSYVFGNACFLNAEVIMPYATLDFSNSSLYETAVTYREEWYSSDYSREKKPCIGMGTVLAGQVKSDPNVASIIYLGDRNRKPGEDKITAGDDVNKKNNSERLGKDNNDFFNNDHLGAS